MQIMFHIDLLKEIKQQNKNDIIQICNDINTKESTITLHLDDDKQSLNFSKATQNAGNSKNKSVMLKIFSSKLYTKLLITSQHLYLLIERKMKMRMSKPWDIQSNNLGQYSISTG